MDNRDWNTAQSEAQKYYGQTEQQARGLANTVVPTSRQPAPIDRAHSIMEGLMQVEHAQLAIYEKLFGPMVEPNPPQGKDGPGNLDAMLMLCCQKLESICSKAHQINAKL